MLVVDDDRDSRQMLATFLAKNLDCQVMAASSVYEAEELLKSGVFDIVISDLEMPGRQGTEIVKALQKRTKPIPLIFYTGRDQPQDFWDSLGYPCHVVLKPNLNELLALVKKLMPNDQIRNR